MATTTVYLMMQITFEKIKKLVIFFVLTSIIVISVKLQTIKAPRDAYMFPPQIKHFTFGYSEQIADFFWVRAIQDFSYCSNLETNSNECKGKSWLFQMLFQVTELSPNFEIVYYYGGLALTIVISDYEGAGILFDKGVTQFPKNWRLLYAAAYHALYEEKNKVKAADLLRKAADNGAPKWLYSLAGGLHAESGNMALGESLLAQMKARNEDPVVIERLERKLKQFKETGSIDAKIINKHMNDSKLKEKSK